MFCHVLWGQTGVSLLIRVSFVKNHIYVLSCIGGQNINVICHVLWGQTGGHSSLGCVICQKSHLCFVMYCGDRRGGHSSLGCVICKKITFMFCHVLWGQTGGHSSLGCVICQKNHIRASYVNWVCVVSAQSVASDIGDMQWQHDWGWLHIQTVVTMLMTWHHQSWENSTESPNHTMWHLPTSQD